MRVRPQNDWFRGTFHFGSGVPPRDNEWVVISGRLHDAQDLLAAGARSLWRRTAGVQCKIQRNPHTHLPFPWRNATESEKTGVRGKFGTPIRGGKKKCVV